MIKHYDFKYLKIRDAYLRKILNDIIVDNSMTYEEKKNEIYNTMNNFYYNTTTPIFSKYYASKVPDIKTINETIRNIYIDELCLTAEIDNLSNKIVNHENIMNETKKSIIDEIDKITNSIKTTKFALTKKGKNIIYFCDEFKNKYNIDENKTKNCTIDTKNEITYLDVVDQKNIIKSCNIIEIETNGYIGENRGFLKINKSIENETLKELYKNIIPSETTKQDINSIKDAEDDTLFEIEQLAANDAELKLKTDYYDCEDIMVINDIDAGYKLAASITIDIGKIDEINAIKITPNLYLGNIENYTKSCSITVERIEVSNDNINYENILNQPTIINSLSSGINQTFYDINSYTNSIKMQMFEKGFFIFKPTQCRYIKIYLSTKDSHRYMALHEKITKYATDNNGNIIKSSGVTVKRSHAPLEFINSTAKAYMTNDGIYYEKNIVPVLCEQRYAISLKGIDIYKNIYSESGEIVSKEFIIPENKKIKRISLDVDEYIPKSFIKDKSKINKIIEYYISFDGIEWIKIMPSHRMPYTDDDAKIPKIININSVEEIKLNTINYTKQQNINKIYLKAILNRPNENKLETPILKRYSIKAEIE